MCMLGIVADMHLVFLGSCFVRMITYEGGITWLKGLVLQSAGTRLVSIAVE